MTVESDRHGTFKCHVAPDHYSRLFGQDAQPSVTSSHTSQSLIRRAMRLPQKVTRCRLLQIVYVTLYYAHHIFGAVARCTALHEAMLKCRDQAAFDPRTELKSAKD